MNELSSEEVQEVREILKLFYRRSPQVVDSWTITLETYAVLEKMMTESEKCTKVMHLIPRPGLPANPIGYASKQVRDGLRRFLLSDAGKHYIVCMTVSASTFRREFDRASYGLH